MKKKLRSQIKRHPAVNYLLILVIRLTTQNVCTGSPPILPMNATEIANWTASLFNRQTWGQHFRGNPGAGFGLGGVSLWTLLNSLTSPSDLIKIFIVGGALETFRRLFWRVWINLLSHCYLVATLETSEPSYQWMIVWLARHQSWSTSRSVLITQQTQGDAAKFGHPVQYAQRHNAEVSRHDRPIEFQPMYGTNCNIWYKRSWIQIHRNRGNDGQNVPFGMVTPDSIRFTIYFGGHEKLKALLNEARVLYKSRVANRIRIWTTHNKNRGWTTSMVRPKRGMGSVVLDETIKTTLVEDAKEFLRSEQWYADRGIPWRRGYLLHGCPGSGKTSLIHAIAGELDLDIYVISLSQKDMDDAALNRLITTLPPKSIALMEDIDVAFTSGPARDQIFGNRKTEASGFAFSEIGHIEYSMMPSNHSGGGLTLAGLLGAIDGVAAQEGRILFATTNRYHALDGALKRPGRLDLHFEFKEASQTQAEELFKRFYPADVENSDIEKPLIDLSGTEVTSNPGFNAKDNSESNGDPSEKTRPSSEPETARVHLQETPRLSKSELSILASRFASRIPENEFSMAAIQGHLMRYKTQPYKAIEEIGAFVERERWQKEIERESRKMAEEAIKRQQEREKEKDAEMVNVVDGNGDSKGVSELTGVRNSPKRGARADRS